MCYRQNIASKKICTQFASRTFFIFQVYSLKFILRGKHFNMSIRLVCISKNNVWLLCGLFDLICLFLWIVFHTVGISYRELILAKTYLFYLLLFKVWRQTYISFIKPHVSIHSVWYKVYLKLNFSITIPFHSDINLQLHGFLISEYFFCVQIVCATKSDSVEPIRCCLWLCELIFRHGRLVCPKQPRNHVNKKKSRQSIERY